MLALLLGCRRHDEPHRPPAGPATTAVEDSAASRVDTAPVAPTDTDTGWPECRTEAEGLAVELCAGTDSDLPPSYVAFDATVEAVVLEVGGDLGDAPGAPVGVFDACASRHGHQVRLEDADGRVWTIGWDVDGPIDGGSSGALWVGRPLVLHVRSLDYGYAVDRALSLTDPGPVLFVESFLDGPVLESADRGGLSAEVAREHGCTDRIGPWGDAGVTYPATFADGSRAVRVHPGRSAALSLDDRDVELVVAESYRLLDGCAVACTHTTWIGWTSP
jgi:hypothetical protein